MIIFVNKENVKIVIHKIKLHRYKTFIIFTTYLYKNIL